MFYRFRQLVALVALLIVPYVVHANQCTESKVTELRNRCNAIMVDVKGTRTLGIQKEKIALKSAVKGAAKGGACLKNTVKLIMSCSAPPKPNCPAAGLKVPNTVTKCVDAIKFVAEARKYYKEAKLLIGISKVAFSDQGGDEILEHLAKCERPGCEEYATFMKLLKQDEERIDRNIKRLEDYQKLLEEAKNKAESCKENNCKKVPLSDKPLELEEPTDELETINIPLG